jgi:hypothetical protein
VILGGYAVSKPADEHRPGVKRGAFPTPQAEIERAEPFVPASPDTDDTDGDDTTSDTEDPAATPTPHSGPDDRA